MWVSEPSAARYRQMPTKHKCESERGAIFASVYYPGTFSHARMELNLNLPRDAVS